MPCATGIYKVLLGFATCQHVLTSAKAVVACPPGKAWNVRLCESSLVNFEPMDILLPFQQKAHTIREWTSHPWTSPPERTCIAMLGQLAFALPTYFELWRLEEWYTTMCRQHFVQTNPQQNSRSREIHKLFMPLFLRISNLQIHCDSCLFWSASCSFILRICSIWETLQCALYGKRSIPSHSVSDKQINGLIEMSLVDQEANKIETSITQTGK